MCFPMFISFCGVACHGFNFSHELLCTTRVRQPKDLRRNKSILVILPTQGKKHILQGLSRTGSMGFHAWQLYTVLSESNSSSELEPQFSNPNHKTSGSFLLTGFDNVQFFSSLKVHYFVLEHEASNQGKGLNRTESLTSRSKFQFGSSLFVNNK